jgi:hypothetical protein
MIGCVNEGSSCDGWLAAAAGGLVEEARLAAPGADLVRSLALHGEDRVVAGLRTPGGVGSAWLSRRTSTGVVWDTSLSSDPSRPSDARAVGLAPDGTLIVGGNELLDAAETGWVARVSADGQVEERVRLGGTPSSSTTTVESIAVLDGSSRDLIFIGGKHREVVDGGELTLPIVLELEADLSLSNSKSGIGIPNVTSGVVKTVLTDRPQEVTACAQVDAGVGIARLYDYLSDVHATRVFTEPGLRIALGGCTVTDDGVLVVVGTLERPDGPRPWAAWVDRVSLEPRGTRIYESERGRLEAVAPAVGSGALAVGSSGARPYFLAVTP